MINRIESGQISKSDAIKIALGTLNLVRDFAKELHKRKNTLQMENAIAELDELELRITGDSSPLQKNIEVDAHYQPVTNEIINFSPNLSSQLNKFWEAHIEIATIAESTGKSYMPMKLAEENREKILAVNEKYLKIAEVVRRDPNNEISMYALFYIHVLRTEVIEFSFIQQFKDLLTEFGLTGKYDPEEIFSATNKIGKNNEWKTDARAIRDALAHSKYEIDFIKSPWEIHFKNTKKHFDKIFDRHEFLQFYYDTDILYKSTLMLIFGLITRTIIKQHLIK